MVTFIENTNGKEKTADEICMEKRGKTGRQEAQFGRIDSGKRNGNFLATTGPSLKGVT